MGEQFALIVVMPDASGPGTYLTLVYGPDGDYDKLDRAGHVYCDGSSGWTYIVAPWPLPDIRGVDQMGVA